MTLLRKRLAEIAKLVPNGDRVADIGTDHAYLPIFLRQQDISPAVLACDIRALPLKSAMNNVADSGVTGVDFRLCDGLSAIEKNEVDTVVIAGMGGECIAGILERSWAENSKKRFLLQPMNSPEELRRYLCGRYTLISEKAVIDGRPYTIMEVLAQECPIENKIHFIYCGKLNPEKAEDRKFLQKQYERLKNCADSIKSVPEEADKFKEFSAAAECIEKFLGKVYAI